MLFERYHDGGSLPLDLPVSMQGFPGPWTGAVPPSCPESSGQNQPIFAHKSVLLSFNLTTCEEVQCLPLLHVA